MLCEKTILLAAGAGEIVKLQPPDAPASGFVGKASRVSLLARSTCMIQFVNWDGVSTEPVAPVADPTPLAGAEAPFIEMLANERLSRGSLGQTYQPYTHVRIWGVGAGNLLIEAE